MADVPVSYISVVTFTPAGARSIAIRAPLRWLPPSTDMKPVTGIMIGMYTSAARAGTVANRRPAAKEGRTKH